MPKRSITNQQLLLIRKEIIEFQGNSITFALFNAEKIMRFFSLNKLRLDSADNTLNRLVKAYVKHDENGVPVKLDDKDGMAKWDYKDEAAKTAFEIDYKDFMSKHITIDF